MQYKKQIVGSLEKCYALSTLTVNGTPRLLVAAEKRNPCYLISLDGVILDTVWTEPGGIMTMVPVPGKDGVFLSTCQFFSPNDSADAYLVCAEKKEKGWKITKIADLPFVHRFDLIPVGNKIYVIACTLKSGHEYKNDWRFPGKLWVGVLGEDPAAPLSMKVLKDGLGHNHGYTRYVKNGVITCTVSCEEGVYRVFPPETVDGDWRMEQLIDTPASDAVYMDLDGDGQEELLTISPFHGDTICIWARDGGQWVPVYEYPGQLPFLHAIYGGEVYGRPTVYVGNREGDRLFLGFWYDKDRGVYRYDEVDRGCGPANCLLFERDGHPAILASNREIDEIAIYDVLP